MKSYTETDHARAGERLLADLGRVPVVEIHQSPLNNPGRFAWRWQANRPSLTSFAFRNAAAAAQDAVAEAARLGLPEPVLVLPDGTHIAASDFLAREGGAA